ncbi:MAG: type III PLP-dependent enzyme [Candidatus Omnitrophica bacterium]|nr:type III PLP-dependent enzyme [Candidatus Omnitrophota bacterium]
MKNSEFSPNGNAVENLIRQTLKKYPSPLMLIRRSVLTKQYERFRAHLPKVTPYYAIKANPHPEVIKTFLRLGASFDVASAAEMILVLNLGVAPQKIIFANTIKSIEDIQTAHKRRVKLMTFDNEPELYKIAKHAPGASVIVRIKVENIGSLVELSLKFGADPEQAVFLLRKAKALGLSPEGVSFHVGSQCVNVENYVHALEVSAAIFKEAKQEGLTLTTLDIGGGFPIRHLDQDKHPIFETMARTIRAEMARLFDKKIKFIAEPGRFLVGPAGVLITQVIGRTFRNNKNYYYLNDGIYADFSGIVFDHCKYELKTLRRGQKFLSTVAGPTCDSFDTISLTEELPELDVGSVVYAKNIGAYSSASAVPGFNGFAPAKIVVV